MTHRSLFLGSLLVLVGSLPFATAVQETPTPAPAPAATKTIDGAIKLGRASLLKQITVAKGSLVVRAVTLDNSKTSVAHLTSVDLEGPGLSVALVKEKQRMPVVAGTPTDIELPGRAATRLEVTIDAKERALGSYQGRVRLTVDATTLELPIEWEVVESTTQGDDDRPAVTLDADWAKYTKAGPQPHIVCDRYSHEFGKVLSGERLHTTFKIRNDGEGEMVIIKVGVQCHCTLPRLELPNRVVSGPKLKSDEAYGTLKSGEEATLDCEVDTAGLGGEQRKQIQIVTNDLARSPLTIALTMVVDKPFEYTPSSVSFGLVRRGEAVERVVRMASINQGVFAISGYSLKEPQVFDVDYHEVKTRKNEKCAWEITLRLRDELPCKEYSGKLKLFLEHETIPAVDQLNYMVRVMPDVEWTVDKNERQRSPETIEFGVVKPGTNDVRVVHLLNKNPPLPYRAKEVKMTARIGPEAFAAELIPIEEGQKYDVQVKVVGTPVNKIFSGELVILAESAALPELKIRFRGMWAGPIAPPATDKGGGEKAGGEKGGGTKSGEQMCGCPGSGNGGGK